MFAVFFIAIFASSIVGASVFGISINKLALVPLELYLIICDGRSTFRLDNRQKKLSIWYLVACLGSISGILFSLFYNTHVQYELMERAVLQIISYLFILIPIAFLFWNSRKKIEYAVCCKKALILTARIQALWGIAQFILMQTIGFDLNSVILGGIFGGDWTRYSNIANSSIGVVMRVTGINKDAAFLGLMLVIGFILETKPVNKFLYIICASLALSRVAIVSILFVIVYKAFSRIFKFPSTSIRKAKSFLKYIVAVLILAVIFVQVYLHSPALQQQIGRVLERFATVSTGGDGTSRHIGYPLAMLQLQLFDIPILQKLVGVGNQCGGILMTYYSDDISWLELASNMLDKNYVWTVESDVASVFLETGIIGGMLYYSFYWSSFKAAKNDNIKRTLIITLAVFGIMYNMAGGAFTQLVYISLFATDYVLTTETEASVKGVKDNGRERKFIYNPGQLL